MVMIILTYYILFYYRVQKAVDADPSNYLTWFWLGKVYWEKAVSDTDARDKCFTSFLKVHIYMYLNVTADDVTMRLIIFCLFHIFRLQSWIPTLVIRFIILVYIMIKFSMTRGTQAFVSFFINITRFLCPQMCLLKYYLINDVLIFMQ